MQHGAHYSPDSNIIMGLHVRKSVFKGFNLLRPKPTCSETIARILSKSYTMGCPPVCGDNPQALASGLSNVQVDKHGVIILYHLHQCRTLHIARYFVLMLVRVV